MTASTLKIDVVDFDQTTGQPPQQASLEISHPIPASETGTIISTRPETIRLVEGTGEAQLETGTTYLFQFRGVRGLETPFYATIPLGTITAADLWTSHQVDPATLQPLPTYPSIAEAFATIKASVDAILAGAPGQFDTFLEVATKFGLDEATTTALAALVAAKAPLDSPTFTGTVTGITAGMVGAEPTGTAAAAIAALAAVARSGAYADLTGKPILGTAAAQPTSAFDAAGAAASAQTAASTDASTKATAAQANAIAAAAADAASKYLAKTAAATVATSGAYADLTGKPTLGSAASQPSSAFDPAGAATAAQTAAATDASTKANAAQAAAVAAAAALASSTYPTLNGSQRLAIAGTQLTPAVIGADAAGAAAAITLAGLGGITPTAVDTKVTTAINGLLNGAPGALDTLKELADALGDDANFATTIANQLASKLNSSDAANAYATLAQVVSNPTVALAAAGTLTAGAPNTVDGTSGNYSVTLPTPTKIGQLLPVERIDATSNTITVAATTGATLRGSASGTAVLYGVGVAYEALLFVAESLTSWRPLAGHKTKSWLDAVYEPKGLSTATSTALAGLFDALGAATSTVSTHNLTASSHPRLVISDALAIPRVSGVPTDALFVTQPPDGTIVLDTSDSPPRFYARIAGAWTYMPITGSPATPFVPSNISGLTGWWDASQLTGLNDGDAVASWPDLSGNGWTMTQATAGSRPTFKTNQYNGKPCVRFAGAQSLTTANFSPVLTQPYTLFVVAKASMGAEQDILGGGTLNRLYFRARSGNYFTLWQYQNSGGTANVLTNGTNDGAAKVFSIVAKGGTAGGGNNTRLRVNASEITSDSMGLGVPSNLILGTSGGTGNPFLTGDIMECILYNRELTTAEITSVESYLS